MTGSAIRKLMLSWFTPAGLAAQDAAIVVRLGSDTLSVERFTRTASHMEGEVVRRLPGAARWRYTVNLDDRGLPRRLELTPVRGSPAATLRLRRITVIFDRDSADIAIERDTVAHRRIAAPNGIPLLPETFGFFELWTSWLRRSGADTGTVTAIAPLGGPQGPLVVRLAGDSGFARIFGGDLRLRTDAGGRLLALDGSATTLKYTAERVASVDLDQAFTAFAARDSARGMTGPFISRRDTVRASVGVAQIWIDYGRPSRRGRAVFAGGVLGDTLWRTGANAATQLRTDRDLVVGGRALPAGIYSLWTHIDEGTAELVINGQSGQWGTQYDRTRDVIRVPLRRARIAGPPVEMFTIEVLSRGATAGLLRLSWDDTELSVPFVVR